MKSKICPICGKKFKPKVNNQRFCTEECREVYRTGYQAEYQTAYKAKPTDLEHMDSLTRKAVEAREAGMTYGKYIAQKEKKCGIVKARYEIWKIRQQERKE